MRESLKWIVIYIWYHLGLNSVLHFGQTYVFDIIMTYKMTNSINTGIAIKYHGTSKWLPNQLTWQEDSIRVEISKSKEINIFFISSPPFWFYYSTLWGGVQEVKQTPFARSATSLGASPHHCEAHHLPQATSFICVRLRRNDVDLWSNDVACKHANDVVFCGHKWKNPESRTFRIFWVELTKKMLLIILVLIQRNRHLTNYKHTYNWHYLWFYLWSYVWYKIQNWNRLPRKKAG